MSAGSSVGRGLEGRTAVQQRGRRRDLGDVSFKSKTMKLSLKVVKHGYSTHNRLEIAAECS